MNSHTHAESRLFGVHLRHGDWGRSAQLGVPVVEVVEVVGLVCVLCCAVLSESGQIAEGVCHWSLQCLGIDRLTGDRAYVRTAERQTIIRCVCEGGGGRGGRVV